MKKDQDSTPKVWKDHLFCIRERLQVEFLPAAYVEQTAHGHTATRIQIKAEHLRHGTWLNLAYLGFLIFLAFLGRPWKTLANGSQWNPPSGVRRRSSHCQWKFKGSFAALTVTCPWRAETLERSSSSKTCDCCKVQSPSMSNLDNLMCCLTGVHHSDGPKGCASTDAT